MSDKQRVLILDVEGNAMPQKDKLQREQTPKGRKGPKRLPPISTDAALFTSTIFAFFLQSTPQSFITHIINAQVRSESQEDFERSAFEALKPVIANHLTLACDVAAHQLALVLFLEKLWKGLNPDDPKHIVAIYFCAIRLIKNQKEFKGTEKLLISQLGKGWLWDLTWGMALLHEIVKKNWDREEAHDPPTLYYWQIECEKFAYNYWSRKKEKFETIKSQKSRMIKSLYKRLGLG